MKRVAVVAVVGATVLAIGGWAIQTAARGALEQEERRDAILRKSSDEIRALQNRIGKAIGNAPIPPSNDFRALAVAYFDAAMAGRSPYRLAGVTRFDIRAYELLQTTPELVAVRLTFGARAGSDIIRTKKFLVSAGRLMPFDREDTRSDIRDNLNHRFSSAIFQLVKQDREDCTRPITMARIQCSKIELPAVDCVEGEDYSLATITNLTRPPIGEGGLVRPIYEISLPDKEGIPVVYRFAY